MRIEVIFKHIYLETAVQVNRVEHDLLFSTLESLPTDRGEERSR